MEKFSLVVKGRLADARKALQARGLVDTYYCEVSQSSTVVYAEASPDTLHAWYGETTLADIIPGIGYPMGSLLYFSSLPKVA